MASRDVELQVWDGKPLSCRRCSRQEMIEAGDALPEEPGKVGCERDGRCTNGFRNLLDPTQGCALDRWTV